MARQVHLPVLAFGLLVVMAAGALLIGVISYIIVDLNTRPADSIIIPQVNALQTIQPADNFPQPENILLSPEAVKKMVENITGQKVTGLELEQVRGIRAYEVKAGPYELFIDAFTGEILYQKHEDRKGSPQWHKNPG